MDIDTNNFKEVDDFTKVLFLEQHIGILLADCKLKNRIIKELKVAVFEANQTSGNVDILTSRVNKLLDKTSQQKEYIVNLNRKHTVLKNDYKELQKQYGRY